MAASSSAEMPRPADPELAESSSTALIGNGDASSGLMESETNEENDSKALKDVDKDQQDEAKSSGTQETVKFSLIFGKQKYPIEAPLDLPVADFRKIVHEHTSVLPAMQKLMCKGPMKDGVTLREAKVSNACKVMLVGSTLSDIMAVNTKPSKEQMAKTEEKAAAKEPLCKQKVHSKVIEKGIPEDALPGIKNVKDALPLAPLSGMRNKYNHKVRLTFKLELDQLWIGTPERTEKIPMNRISSIVNEPVEGHEEYHILGFQLGTTEASRYWVYWVPAQYVDSIKHAVLGS